MTPSYLIREFEDANAKSGCSLCWLETRQVTRYLTGVANDGVNNIPLRQKLAERGGYCPPHCAQFADIANPLSAAVLLEAFLKQRLTNAEKGNRPTKIQCEACEVAGKANRTFVKSIRQHRKSDEVQQKLLKAELCLTHLELISRNLPEAVRQQLVAQHDDLRENLAELIRKHDYRFSDETLTGEEKRGVAGALELLGVETK